jgi:glycosyltransferase involved in cell wall biosynthesis
MKKYNSNTQLKILISHTSVYKKDGWGRIYPLAIGLVKQGCTVTILTTNPRFSILTKKETMNGVNIIIYPEFIPSRASKMGFGFMSLLLKIFHILVNNYEVVHSDNGHRPLSGIPTRMHKRIHNSIYVSEWYDWYGLGGEYDKKNKLFKLLFGRYELKKEIVDKKFADGIVVLSEILKLRAEQIKPIERIIKIHGGADVTSIPFLEDNSELKKKFKLDSDTLTFGYINSGGYDYDEIAPLVHAIINGKIKHKIKILVFGGPGREINNLPEEFKYLFRFYGWIDFGIDFEKLQCVDVFCLFKDDSLGNQAGWPNCIGDYLACGRTVLLNPVGEMIEFTEKFPFAFITTTKKENDIIEKIQYIVTEKESINLSRKKIRELAEEVISWESKSKELLTFYQYLLNNKY